MCICIFVQAAICGDVVAALQEQRTCNMTHSDMTVWHIRQFLNMCIYIYLLCKMCIYIYMLVQAATCGNVVAALQEKGTCEMTHLDATVWYIRQISEYVHEYISLSYKMCTYIYMFVQAAICGDVVAALQAKRTRDMTHLDVIVYTSDTFWIRTWIYISII